MFVWLFSFNLLFGQNGSSTQPFTSLGQAHNVTANGVYYFNLSGTTFSTYVLMGGWVQVAIDFGGGVGSLPQSSALSLSTRGILNTTVLSRLTSATVARIRVSTGAVDVTSNNATHLTRIRNNSALSVGGNDNTLSDSWTGTGASYLTTNAGSCNATSNNGLHQRIIHIACNTGGMHWIPVDNMQQIANNQGNISSSNYFQLMVQAPFVAVVLGPNISTQPASTVQNLCINANISALSVTASSPTAISYQWYSNNTSSNAGGTLIAGATSSTYTPPTNTVGTKYYYVVCTNAQGSTTSTVSGAVTVSALSVAGTASSDQTICSGTSPTNLSLVGNTGTIQWSSSTDNINFNNISGATVSSLSSAQMGSLSATTYYRAIVTNNACPATTSNIVTVSVNNRPTISSVTGNSRCGTGSLILSAVPSSGSISWFSSSSGGVALATGLTFTTPSISTSTIYFVEATSNGCVSTTRTSVSAVINSLPTSSSGNLNVELLVVAGGGGAGSLRGGGGGGGGYISVPSFSVMAGSTTAITVGVGGSPGYQSSGLGVHATNGTNSSFGTTHVAMGGGGGGSYGGGPQNGYAGGSGGGGANQSSSANTGFGGSGTAGQGFGGGNSRCGGGGEVSGGGGGGAGGAGSNGSSGACGTCSNRPYNPGNGGNGIQNSISGSAEWYSGGGGGGGLGGNCTSGFNISGNNGLGGGQASFGGGGQCKVVSNNFVTESGGPGIVIIKYQGPPVATGGTITQVGGYTIHTFTSNGNFIVPQTAVVNNASRCGSGIINFTGTSASGYSLNWYDAPNGGNLLATNTVNFTTPVLNNSTNYYTSLVNTSTGCESATRNTVLATVNPLPNLTINASSTALCQGQSLTLTANGANSYIWNNGVNNGVSFTPSSTNTYAVTGTNSSGCSFSTSVTVSVNVASSAPTLNTINGSVCPNSNVNLIASGGTTGTGAQVAWYTGPNGTGTFLGYGNNFTYAPTSSQTIYARREGACNTTSDAQTSIQVRNYVYASNASNSNNFCTDNNGWKHFYVGNDLIFSAQGDFSNCPSGYPRVTISNNNSFYQQNAGPFQATACANGLTPGEQRFEMSRSWNLDMGGGAPIGSYNVRFYYQASEKQAIETAAANWIATYPACNYQPKYATANGFYWFKNTGSAYVAPQYDGTQYTGPSGSTSNGVNYAQMNGITSFSGGTGAIILVPDQTLPIDWQSFTGTTDNKFNYLNWVTASEQNTQSFEVQRSKDGVSFERIGTVTAAGTSNTPKSYNFTDRTPLVGQNYYRIRMIENTGNDAYSNVVVLEVSGQPSGYTVYPNPAADQITLELEADKTELVEVQIIDVLGRVVVEKNFSVVNGKNQLQLDLKKLVTGNYSLKASYKNTGRVITEKITKK